MTLQTSDAIAHIRHTLASEDVPDIGAYRILNDAGQYLVNMHNWAWCEGVQANLSLTGDQPYVWLPEDFREIMAIQPTNGLNAGFRLTTQERLLSLRSLAVTSTFEFHAALVHAPRSEAATGIIRPTDIVTGDDIEIADAYNPAVRFTCGSGTNTATTRFFAADATAAGVAQNLAEAINNAPALYLRASVTNNDVMLTHARVGARGNSMSYDTNPDGTNSGTWTTAVYATGIDGGPVRARLDLWPTPGQDEKDRLMVYYRRGWQACDSDNALIPIPDWIETLYLTLVRAFARGYERESEVGIEQRIAAVRQGPVFAAAMLRDKEMLQHIGPMMGGAALTTRATYDHMWNFTGVTGPI